MFTSKLQPKFLLLRIEWEYIEKTLEFTSSDFS